MVDFLELSLSNKILLALATLKNNRSPEEVTEWINSMVEIYAKGRKKEQKLRWSEGTVKNQMREMSGQKYEKQKEFVLALQKESRKFTYKTGKYTVDTRLSALVIFLLWQTYEANNSSLTKEQAIKIAENNKEVISEIVRGKKQVEKDVMWLVEEITKENPSSVDILDWKFDFMIKADYFRNEKRSGELVTPTERLKKHEKDYIEALIHLLPELERIQY